MAVSDAGAGGRIAAPVRGEGVRMLVVPVRILETLVKILVVLALVVVLTFTVGQVADRYVLKTQFDDKEIAYLTTLIAAINFWNTVQISLRAVPQVEDVAVAA